MKVLSNVNRYAADFTKRFGVELPNSAMTSPKGGLNFAPAQLPDGWESWKNESYSHTGSLVGIDRCSVWYFSNGLGKAEQITKWQAETTSKSNYAHSEDYYQQGETLGGFLSTNRPPLWAKFIIQIQHGAYTREHHSYGCRVSVWSMPKM